MALATDITPNALSLTWGASKKQCLEILAVSPAAETAIMLAFDLTLQKTLHQVSLWFDEQQGLERIEVIVYESKWFWDDSPIDELEATYKEYQIHYENLVRLHSQVLGAPDYSGRWGEEGFPEPQYSRNTGELTYWNRPEGRMQIGIGQEDRETPVFVEMVCYRVW
jgi:hypothetical protein